MPVALGHPVRSVASSFLPVSHPKHPSPFESFSQLLPVSICVTFFIEYKNPPFPTLKSSLPAMLFTHCSDLPHSFLSKFTDDYTIVITAPPVSSLSSMSPGSNNGGTRVQAPGVTIINVAQALEVARESPEGAQDPIIVNTLENAITEIWAKIEREPSSYVLTRDEFAVFNYFQDRFMGQPLAVAARRRYWNSLELPNGTS